MLELNRIYCMDNTVGLKQLEDECVDLTLTSPPYDNLRNYDGYAWDFKSVAQELFRVTKPGGVVVWVVADATVKGSETGTSFRQALAFIELGFNLHDTMIYTKSALPKNHNRYEQEFEYMFVLSKGKPKTTNLARVPCKYPEPPTARLNSRYSITTEAGRSARSGKTRAPVGADKIKGNVWYYPTGRNHSTRDNIAFEHPAIFPEQLASDHILSWSNPGDVVLDPFMGSGTTGKMASLAGRQYIGFEISQKYCAIAEKRISDATGLMEFFLPTKYNNRELGREQNGDKQE